MAKSNSRFGPLQISMTAINAALYAVIGLATSFGILAPPPIGAVRFWPVVIIPGIFATLFGPLVGGLGAAIGIFVSDMFVHGNALLSLTAGVTSNFIGFYLVGYIARKKLNLKKLAPVLLLGALIIVIGIYSIMFLPDNFGFTGLSQTDSALLFLVTVGGTYALVIVAVAVWPAWKSYEVASVVGLAVGSAIIGIALWGFTQFFTIFGLSKVPFYFSFLWFIWTFTTEIPFLMIPGPLILKAVYMAFPSLKPKQE